MPGAPAHRISVVVVSRGRPTLLRRCLASLRHQTQREVEVIVVACPAGVRAVSDAHPDAHILEFDEANISAARNLGVSAASGDILAFIDDDAVAVPAWLSALCAAFDDPAIGAAGGPVIGRNGFSTQWGAREVDGQLTYRTATPPPVWQAKDGWTPKLEGTNFAIRTSVLIDLGGFDTRYHFYLDETDLCLRYAAQGGGFAFVDQAVVHHGSAASPGRRADRAPLDLFEIGASVAVMERAGHIAPGTVARQRDHQRGRVLSYIRDGRLPLGALKRLLTRYDEGVAVAPLRSALPLPRTQLTWKPFATIGQAGPPRVLGGHWSRRKHLTDQAKRLAADGVPTLVLLWSYTPINHRLTFQSGGYWLQTGGRWGRTDRGRQRPILPRTTDDMASDGLFALCLT